MNPGGVARHVVDLANGLVDKGVGLIVAANDGPFRSRLRKDIMFVNLPLIRQKAEASVFLDSLIRIVFFSSLFA